MPDNVAERVARGSALLDEKMPGWDRRIDLDRLDLMSSCRCILGQLHLAAEDDPYLEGLAAVGIDYYTENDARFGFNTWDAEGNDAFLDLEYEWKRVITERRPA